MPWRRQLYDVVLCNRHNTRYPAPTLKHREGGPIQLHTWPPAPVPGDRGHTLHRWRGVVEMMQHRRVVPAAKGQQLPHLSGATELPLLRWGQGISLEERGAGHSSTGRNAGPRTGAPYALMPG